MGTPHRDKAIMSDTAYCLEKLQRINASVEELKRRGGNCVSLGYVHEKISEPMTGETRFQTKLFKTKKAAAEYHDRLFVREGKRTLNAFDTWASDYDPNTGIAYVVRAYHGIVPVVVSNEIPVPVQSQVGSCVV